jgi:hypothetical protein
MDSSIQNTSIMLHFSVLPDPRKPRNQLYTIYDIISTAILSSVKRATLNVLQDYKGELERTTAKGLM